MISLEVTGDFKKTERFLAYLHKGDFYSHLQADAKKGVVALGRATPMRTGLTAASWTYEIEISPSETSITWLNNNLVSGTSLAILLQYGHGTGTGGFVAGRDYINPAIQPVFDEIADSVWKAVTSA